MEYARFFLLTLCLSAWIVREVTPLGEVVLASPVNTANNVTVNESKINSELTEDKHNLNKTLGKEYKKDDSNIPRIRKVTLVDSLGVVDKKVKEKVETLSAIPTENASTSTVAPESSKAANLRIINAYGAGELKLPAPNVSKANKTIGENKYVEPMLLANNTKTTANPAESNNGRDGKGNVNHTNNNKGNVDGSMLTGVSKSSSSTTKSSAAEISSKIASAAVGSKLSNKNTTASIAPAVISSTTTATSTTTTPSTTTESTTTSSTTTTTTTKTTPKPKKPEITYGVEDFPDLDKESLAIHNVTQKQVSSTSSSSGKFPLPEAPYAQPSQEFSNTSFHGGRDYILPIVSMIFIIPLVIGILITTYRRFRDCWSTRHYRRMDFLVDGMYND